MNDATHSHDDHGHGHDEAPHFTRRGYLIGFLLSVVLTAIPFWLVMTGALQNPAVTTILIIGFAVVQILVHTVCFLHVNTRAEGGWTLMAYVFTAVLVVIVLAGSLWIMYHLNSNMMPMPSAEMGAPS
ncbi:cytochrome o ubiquinol oxidase operon protein cyoD [Sphingomonas naasensis]|uniref:Cytochrome bo(3) ubiquinol oxidase subunit 4 n=1 Tax=Sphingomonas naasensis TaxID=1344951 RepID=A0A4S1WMY4_9SPHN|nr:cytochrome o ubiquinol oxidase subunit IV [Sphingomonas naasensis]NIJ20558.1 cytochrome o ubiquinol oxidase operon protein cyoD [Sphingomonas naasensis]TGX44641.1 cytochrome o ubiquinol oxidase subunit IV [Sphingomonas naasensis]